MIGGWHLRHRFRRSFAEARPRARGNVSEPTWIWPDAPNRPITWGSACTGSNGDLVVAKCMVEAYRAAGLTIFDVIPKFSCEIVAPKQQWAEKVSAALFPDAEAACSFSDIMDLQGDYAMCRTHGRKCVVPSVDVFVCCTSCRDFCRWSGPNGLVLLQSSSTGGSAQTFAGFLKYLEKHRPSMVLFENVDSMEDKVAPNFLQSGLGIRAAG